MMVPPQPALLVGSFQTHNCGYGARRALRRSMLQDMCGRWLSSKELGLAFIAESGVHLEIVHP